MGALLNARIRNRLLRLRLGGSVLPPLAAANLKALDRLDPAAPVDAHAFTVVDLETTGLDTQKSRIVSIGAVKLIDGRIHLGRMFDQLVDPGHPMAPEAITVHGIVPSMLAGGATGAQALDRLLAFVNDDILVAHPAGFDLAFLNRLMLARYGFRLQNLVIDNRRLCARLLAPRLPAVPRKPGLLGSGAADPARQRQFPDLEDMARQLGIRIYQRHSATGDALATAMIFQRCLARLSRDRRGRLGDLIRAGTP